MEQCEIASWPCACRIKSITVPARGLQQWRRALAHSPLGSDSVVAAARYLGFAAVCMTMTPDHAPAGWTRQCLDHIRQGTWERHVSRMELRGPALASHPGSPSHRAACWNTYVVAVVPYPAQLCLPSAGHRARMAACLGRLFHTAAWAPWWSVAGLRLYFGVRGAPRCSAVPVDGGSGCWRRQLGPPWRVGAGGASGRAAEHLGRPTAVG